MLSFFICKRLSIFNEIYGPMKIITLSFILFCSLVIKAGAQDSIGTNARERKVLKLINSLPEVVRENAYRKRANIKALLHAYIQNTPTKTNDYYSVSVSEYKGERLFTYDWYLVNPRTNIIRYWDIPTDKTMSLKEWRKQMHRHKKT